MSLQRDFYIKCLLFSVLASLKQPCLCIHFSEGERDLRSTWGCWRGSVTLLRYGSVTRFGALAAMSWSTSVLPHCCRLEGGWGQTHVPMPPLCCLVFLWLEICKAEFEAGIVVHLAQSRVKLPFALPKQRSFPSESLFEDLKWNLVTALERLAELSASFQQRSHPFSNTLLLIMF